MELVLFLGCLGGIGLGLFLLDCAFTRRRLQRLEAEAKRLGFSFARTAQPFAGSAVEGLSLLADSSAEEYRLIVLPHSAEPEYGF